MKIAIASDHAGFNFKEKLILLLPGIDFLDFGTFSETSVDYPDFALKACESIRDGYCQKGVLICGTGIGMSITANKVESIRAALCHCTDYAVMSRKHNDANVLCLGSRFISEYLAKEIITLWLKTPFETGRHQKRLEKIKQYESKR